MLWSVFASHLSVHALVARMAAEGAEYVRGFESRSADIDHTNVTEHSGIRPSRAHSGYTYEAFPSFG